MITCPTCGAHGDQRHLRSCRSVVDVADVMNRPGYRRAATLPTKGVDAPATDAINPAHYRSHASGVEVIVITEHMNFCLGNVVKYVLRAGKKGDEVEDLKKARWYLDREIRRLEREAS